MDDNGPATIPGHRQYSPFLVVVTVALIDVLLEHGEHSHHPDGLLTGAVDTVFVPVQNTKRVIGRFQTVKT